MDVVAVAVQVDQCGHQDTERHQATIASQDSPSQGPKVTSHRSVSPDVGLAGMG